MSKVVIDNLARKLEERGASDIEIKEVNDNENSLNRLGKIYLSSLMQNGSRKRIIYGENGKKIATFSDGKVEFNREDLSNEEKKELTNLVEERFGLANLEKIANLIGKPRFQLSRELDGSTIFGKLQLRDSEMAQNMPDGITMDSLFDGFITYINPKELPDNSSIKNKDAKLIPVITSKDGKNVFEIPPSVLECQDNDSQSLKYEREKNTLKEDENGNVVQAPENSARITELARFKIPDTNNRNRNDAEYFVFRTNNDYLKGTSDSKGYNIELYYERVKKSESEYDLKKGTHGDMIFSEEIPPYDRAEEISDKANDHRADLGTDDDARDEIRDRQRDDTELNQQRAQEEKNDADNVKEKYEKDGQSTAEVASQVNERNHYMKIAERINKAIDTYGANYIYDKLMKVKKENQNISDEQLEAVVQQQLEGERVPGPNPRRI